MSIGARVAAGIVLSLLCARPAPANDVTGKWSAEFDTQVGVQKYVFDFKLDGEKLSGKASFERMGQKGEAEIKEGTVVGDVVSFTEMLDFQGNLVPITYTGRVVGDEMKLTRKVGDFAVEKIVAKRVKP